MSAPALPPPRNRRARLMIALRLLLGAAILGLIATQMTSFADLHAVLLGAHPGYLLGCIAVYYLGVWISCLKWQALLRAQGISTGIGPLVRWYLAGAFVSNLLPSDVGGDLGRGALAGRVISNQAGLWSSIVMERLTGLLAMLALAAGVVSFAPTLLGWSSLASLVVLLLGAIGIGVGLTLLMRATPVVWLPVRVAQAIEQIHTVLRLYARRPGVLLACLGLSLVYHALTALSLWFVLLSLDPSVPPGPAFVAPVAGMVGLLPLTPGGLGVREGVLAVLLQRADVDGDVALAAALLARVLLWIVSFSGLPVLLAALRPRARSRETPVLRSETVPSRSE